MKYNKEIEELEKKKHETKQYTVEELQSLIDDTKRLIEIERKKLI